MKVKLCFLIVVLILGIIAPTAFAISPCPFALENVPILSGGRVKALRVHAREVIKFLTGKTEFDGKNATTLYCELSLSKTQNDFTTQQPPIRINHIESRRLLGLNENTNEITFTVATAALPLLRHRVTQLPDEERQTSAGKDLVSTIDKIEWYRSVISGDDWLIPHLSNGDVQWMSVHTLKTAQPDLSPPSLIDFILTEASRFETKFGTTHRLEAIYDRLGLFHFAMLTTLLTLGLLVISKKSCSTPVVLTLMITLCLELAAVVLRTLISGRSPVSNMYETVMWAGIGGLLLATLLAIIKKERIILMAGLVLNLLTLLMMTFANNMLDPSIKPLVPVLRDNFWLATHVTCITLSYAALALSWLLANFEMVREIVKRKKLPDLQAASRLQTLTYDCVKAGVVLLAAGIILGAIWADYSWGRFWGWDPKETWSLITLMIYIAVLHGRMTGWITRSRFIPLTAFAFLSVLMTWFGVNYVLMTGLHSYGFSQGGTIFLASIGGIQLMFLGAHALLLRK